MRHEWGEARQEKSACFVMEFYALRAWVEVGKGAMMIPQPSSTCVYALMVVLYSHFFGYNPPYVPLYALTRNGSRVQTR